MRRRKSQTGSHPRSAQHRETPKGSEYRIVAGYHAAIEAMLVRPQAVRKIWVSMERRNENERFHKLIDKVKALGASIESRSKQQLDSFCTSHQGVLLFVDETPSLSWDSLSQAATACVVGIDGVQDPQNFGAIIRTSWLFGVKGIVIPGRRQVLITPTVGRVARGGIEHVPIFIENQLADSLRRLKENGFWVFGLSEKGNQNLWKFNEKLPQKLVWVVGGEEKGLKASTVAEIDEMVSIPHEGAAGSSFNVSVALALALGESYRVSTDHLNG